MGTPDGPSPHGPMSREEIRNAVGCPRCGVLPGQPCVGDGGGRRRRGKNHSARSRHAFDPERRAALDAR